MPLTLSFDAEWANDKLSVLGLAWDEGRFATATWRNPTSMSQFLEVLHKADRIAGHSAIDADLAQLEKEGFDISKLLPKCFDTRIAFHAAFGHLAGSGSFDLRSVVLLLNGRQGKRFPLDFKHYRDDILSTCSMDAAAVSWCVPTLDRLIASQHLEKTVDIGLKCSDIFRRMKQQGIRLDLKVLEQIYNARKAKTEHIIEKYHLWEERGKKVVKRVPIWRSNKILDIFEQQFGVRPKDRQRSTWDKLAKTPLSPEAQEFVAAIIDLGKGANDSHWLGKAEETEDGLDFSKVDKDGFIYTRYDICGSPDRAIASSPNIQNFPRPADDPRPVPLRQAVIPLRQGEVILGIDFSGVETITNAIESDDWDRVRATLEGRISHEGTAALVNAAFGLNLTRQQGKAINHGFDKGESPHNLGRTLFHSDRPSRQQVSQCQDIFGKMLREYPKTSAFRDRLWERAQDNPLVVTNSFGRRLMCFSRAKYGQQDDVCVEANTLVLTASLSWVPIKDIQVGDELLTLGEFSPTTRSERLWEVATVTARKDSYRETSEFITDVGSLVATEDHKVLACRASGSRKGWRWAELGALKYSINRHNAIAKYVDVWQPCLGFDAGWLAGLLDGEGHVGAQSGLRVGYAQNAGLVSEKAAQIVSALGFNLGVDNKVAGSVCYSNYIQGRQKDKLRFLGQVRPTRLLNKFLQLVKAGSLHASYSGKLINGHSYNKAILQEKISVGLRHVVDIQTTSGTFLANGFLVHNCGRYARHDPAKKYWCSCAACAPRRDRFKYAIAFLGRSSAFDALLRAMARIWYGKLLDNYSLPYLEVHDELDFSVPLDKAAYYSDILVKTFQEPIPELNGVSLPAEAKWATNWAGAH